MYIVGDKLSWRVKLMGSVLSYAFVISEFYRYDIFVTCDIFAIVVYSYILHPQKKNSYRWAGHRNVYKMLEDFFEHLVCEYLYTIDKQIKHNNAVFSEWLLLSPPTPTICNPKTQTKAFVIFALRICMVGTRLWLIRCSELKLTQHWRLTPHREETFMNLYLNSLFFFEGE